MTSLIPDRHDIPPVKQHFATTKSLKAMAEPLLQITVSVSKPASHKFCKPGKCGLTVGPAFSRMEQLMHVYLTFCSLAM